MKCNENFSCHVSADRQRRGRQTTIWLNFSLLRYFVTLNDFTDNKCYKHCGNIVKNDNTVSNAVSMA